MNTWGIVNSYGVFQPYYTTTLSRPPSDIAWIGSFEVFLLFFIGAFTGRLTDAGYFRPLFIAGFILVVLGMVTTSFCTQYWQFFLAQGICMGLGNGFLFCPSLSTASTYFDKKKALALGFVSIGSSTGGMIYPSMVRQLLPKIGFGWTIRAIALVQMVTLLVTSLILKPRIKPRKAGSLVEWAAFKELEYSFYALGSWLNYLGVFFASYYIASYSRDIVGLSYTSSLNLLLLLNGTGVPGRLIPAYFASYYIGTVNMFIPMSFISGIMMLCWPAVSSVTGLYVWTTFYGFFTGAIQSLMPSGIGTLTADPRKQGTRMGMTFTLISFAVLIGQPIAGAIISAEGGKYTGAQAYAGASERLQTPKMEPAAVNDALFNHLVLPAQLPQRQEHDRQLRLVEGALLERLIGAATIMSGSEADNPSHSHWQSLRQTLIACQQVNRAGRIDKSSLVRRFQNLDPSGCLILHVESQNAGLIVRRAQDPIFKDCVVFEAFEASPRNEDVLATKAALVWDFPGIAVAVPYTTFSDDDFQTSVASFIEQASLENTKTFAAHTFKAGAIVYEYRNTGDPSIITSMLMAILEENGRRIAPTLLRKRVRDDVCWNRAEKPWRRLPLWLVIRVGIQRYLSMALDAESGRLEYKFYIAVVLSKFLDEAPSYNIGIERVHFLKKKICRRLVKLDLDKQRCVNDSIVSRYGFLFDFLGPKFNKSIENCNRVLNVALAQERASLHKHIPLLPRKAADADLRLSLRISRAHLHNALERFKVPRHRRRQQTRLNEGLAEAAKDHLSHYAQSYHKLIDRELELSHLPGETCSEIAKRITDYANMAVPLYEGNPEQKSQMILTVMEMWQRMDAIACHWFPLLQEFHPVLHPQMLDVLLLPQYTDMARLNTLQLLLSARVKRANSERRNIFEDPSSGCFGERYYSESEDACSFSELHDEIVEMADSLRAAKESEWKKKSQKYDDLIRQIDTSVCSYLRDDFDPLGREQHDPNCPRCSMMWSAQKMRIAIFENPLPSDPVVTRATIFELACPKEFAVYRETTWWILRQLATPFNDEGNPPRCLLKDYLQLKPFFEPNRTKVGLASTTKPFITTHYTQATLLDDLSLQAYIECCITVQDNLVVEVGALPQVLRHAVVSDLKLSYRLASLVCASIMRSPDIFRLAIRAVWPEPEDRPRQIYNLCSEQPSWIVCDIQENEEGNLVQVHYNYVQGLLLVDNKPLGKLPKAPEHIEVLNELFGDQALLTFPSSQRGMDYTLCLKPRNYRIDVGFEAGNMIVRATKGNQCLQLIPRKVFRTQTSWDLPGPLLDDCRHWLDLRTGKLFITCAPDIWNIHTRNWTLDIHRGVCQRPRGAAGFDRLVDTYSPLFNRVSRIFDGFENKGQILVYQPASRHLEVEIRRLQLLFYVNHRQILQSPQLGSEIDLDQDAGTWYGLSSKLVFRNPRDPSQRSILVPLVFDELKVIELPMWEKYENFRPNQLPQLEQLMRIIALHKMPPPKDDGEELQQFASAKQLRKMREKRDTWERRSDEDCKYLANFLLAQWPCEEPGVAELAKSLLIDVGAALKLVRVEWKRLYQNMDLSIHLDAVQNVLDRRQSEVEYEAPVFIASEELFEERLRGGEILRLRTDLLQKTFPALQSIDSESRKPSNQPAKVATKTTPAANEARHPAHIRKPITLPSSNVRSTGTNVLAPSWMSSKTALIPSSDSTAELKQMVASFSKSPSMVRQKYGEDLQRSLDAFVTRKQPKESTNHESTAFVAREASLSLMSIQRRFEKIQQALEKPDDTHSPQQLFWLQAGQLWPAITHITLLEQLRSTAQPITFGKYAKETLIDFGLAITNTQRDLRINDFVRRGDAGRYKDEMSNQGHSNWQPCDHPDWLLLEIEANLLIRPDQVDVALATISPASGNNSVLQMNMGQGKTSCIIPMVAAALANRQNLVRVVVPKALLLQTSQLLQGRLGGLLDRQVRHLPFSRRTPTEEHIIRAYHRVHRTMMKEAGVMKRWNVQYGLHPLRDPIAVPYHAKGVPSEQSEWGHPDVAILFTCLAFYYDGISVSQLTQSLEHLLKSDDPSAEYDKWTQTTESFPESLKAWNSINVDDGLQLVEIWKAVRYNMTTIDYFMNNFVFPQHAKQFRVKLQSNGWDIPLFTVDTPSNNQDSQEISRALTTGFSGTNDNRTMLPLTIKQEDLPGLSHTNAEVLTYLLHKRSRALTLGLGQSKDHTVQAAMRLRQLGTTQSVTFFAPPEVYQSILDLQSKPLGATVDSHDVICWLLDNTCDGIEQLQPLYYAQGIDFCRRMQATVEHPEFLRDKAQREDYLATIKQNEQFSLQQMYEPKRKVKGTGEFRAGSNLKIRSFVKELNTRRKAFQDTGRAVHASALQEVEQEREVAFEVETVRQVKKPQHYPALSFPGLAQDIESFALNGRIPAGSQSFVPVLKSLAKTGTGKKFKVADRSTQARLFVSTEFERTIKLTFDLTNDNFLRNVNWILWSDVAGVALVVVPEEAEMLLPLIRNKGPKHVTHLILYSAPVTRKMLHFSKLDYLSIPPLANDWEAPMWLRVELGLYAGRLYFEWDEYAEICLLLGIDETSLSEDTEGSSDEDLERAQLDGAVESKPSAKPARTGLTPRPLTFCQEWLAARRRGQDFVSTPMGFIAQGKPLQATHPFFRKTDTEKHDKLFVPISRQKVQQDADDQPLDDFGLDYMGENENADSDADDDEIEYNESEMGSDGEDPQVESDSEY
ncbi:hypothetical protein K4K49_009945 [Colletotrichum sp. SAR 10_70]|nr:hypothetical protein K4K50_004177 [Colletotrichum sp. SAR 10_71]KAI8194220.1 hypothetical protein K4K49_009945 [Colletotrichum sp. SAR 10_70]KAI8257175.1 hypothetical protein K4K53_005922 [Colletotrichum sp. SAR 10_77]